MIASSRPFATRAALFTTLFCVVLGLVLPAVFAARSMGNLRGIMETESEVNSDQVSRIISANPGLWRFETTRLEEILGRRGPGAGEEIRRLYDGRGSLVCETGRPLPFPTVSISRPVMDQGEPAGRIEVVRSFRLPLLTALLLSAAGLGGGFLLRRFLPFRAAAEAHEFLGEVMEACTNAIVVLDPKGRVHNANGRFRALTGRSGEGLRGLEVAGMFHPKHRERIREGLLEVAGGRSPKAAFETLLEDPDGQVRTLLFDAVPLSAKAGFRGMVLSLLDITERRAQEAELREREEQLLQAQKMQSLASLAGGVAHDMNNVLAAILGLASTHAQIQPEGSSAREAFALIVTAAERGAKSVDSLLSLARTWPAEERHLDLNAVLREQAGIQQLATRSGVLLTLDLAEELPPMLGDAAALATAVMNLCINAVEAMGDDGRLTLRTRRGGDGWIEAHVEDNGRGMTREVLERAADPFFTTKEVGQGPGLGLSVAFRTVRAHGGHLDIRSEPGHGTRVRLRFPGLNAARNPEAAAAGSAT